MTNLRLKCLRVHSSGISYIAIIYKARQEACSEVDSTSGGMVCVPFTLLHKNLLQVLPLMPQLEQ